MNQNAQQVRPFKWHDIVSMLMTLIIISSHLYSLCLGELAICLFAIFRYTALQTSVKVNIITEDFATTTMIIIIIIIIIVIWLSSSGGGDNGTRQP